MQAEMLDDLSASLRDELALHNCKALVLNMEVLWGKLKMSPSLRLIKARGRKRRKRSAQRRAWLRRAWQHLGCISPAGDRLPAEALHLLTGRRDLLPGEI